MTHTGACCSNRFITSSNIPSYLSPLNTSPGYQVCHAKTLKGLALKAPSGRLNFFAITRFGLRI
jgi:hypothetical protein